MALELPYGIKPVVALSNIDERYGVHNTRAEALTATEGTRKLGLTVGIIESGAVKEYWFREGILDEDLVLKTAESSGSSTDQVDYITLINYSPSEDIQPSAGEVKIGNVIWKTKNESWTDGGAGIYAPNLDQNNVDDFGYLYNYDALERLLVANPGYRLATLNDWYSLKDFLPQVNPVEWDAESIVDPDLKYWDEPISATNSLGLSLIPAGRVMQGEITPDGFKIWGYYWKDLLQGEYRYGVASFVSGVSGLRMSFSDFSNQATSVRSHAIRLVKDI